ncbi:prpF family protein, partial [Vibrio parahaemolyticus AQ3810]
RFMLV